MEGEQLGKQHCEIRVTWPDSRAQLCLGRGALQTVEAPEVPNFPGSTAKMGTNRNSRHQHGFRDVGRQWPWHGHLGSGHKRAPGTVATVTWLTRHPR